MHQIPTTNLHIGTEIDFVQNFQNTDFAIVNVAGNLHAKILGYKPTKVDPNYILYKKDRILSVNFVDGEDPKYYDWQGGGVSVFTQILDFIDYKINFKITSVSVFTQILDFIDSQKDKKVLINCNQGMSRSPSVIMLYLAKRLNHISNNSFNSAMEEFIKIYPIYTPGLGIRLFLSHNWNKIK